MVWPFNACRRVRSQLSAYLDGRLSEKDREGVEAHLARCPACREELASLRATVSLLKRVPQAAVPRSFALREAPARAPARRATPAPLALATAVASLALVFLLASDALNVWEARPVVSPAATASPEVLKEAMAPPVATPTLPLPTATLPAQAEFRAMTAPEAMAEKGAVSDQSAAVPQPSPPSPETAGPVPTVPALLEGQPGPKPAVAARAGWLRPLELALAGLTGLLVAVLAYVLVGRRKEA